MPYLTFTFMLGIYKLKHISKKIWLCLMSIKCKSNIAISNYILETYGSSPTIEQVKAIQDLVLTDVLKFLKCHFFASSDYIRESLKGHFENQKT